MKNIFITGCSSGLGKTLFQMGEKLNVSVFPHFRHKTECNGICGDINDSVFLENISPFLEKNQINVFINNAAVYKNENFLNITDEEIKMIIDTNLTSQILLTKRVYEYFRKQGFGLIININSLSGKYPTAKESVYSATKTGLSAFSKCLQLESIGTKIEIIDLFLGAMKTKITQNRDQYSSFMDTKNISKLIYDVILNHDDIFLNEIIIRKKN